MISNIDLEQKLTAVEQKRANTTQLNNAANATVSRKLRDNLPTATIQFYDNYIPPLAAGTYRITFTHDISGTDENSHTVEKQTQFKVNAPHFSLPSQDIHAIYPPENSQGIMDTHLPYILFNKKALPWERIVPDVERTVPWLALIVLTEDEIQPDTKSSMTDDQEHTINYLILDKEKFYQIMPRSQELAYLSHVRKIDTGGQEVLGLDETGWFSAILANRFPNAGKQNTVFLISVERLIDILTDDYFNGRKQPEDQKIKVPYLKQWSFQCAPADQFSFNQVVQQLLSNTPEEDKSQLLRLPLSSELNISDEVRQTLLRGYILLNNHMQTGEEKEAWYRGPLSAVSVPLDASLPENSNVLIKEDAVPDISYATAWQVGRQLALSDVTFAKDLLLFRQQCHVDALKKVTHASYAQHALQATLASPSVSLPKRSLLAALQGGLVQKVQAITESKAANTHRLIAHSATKTPLLTQQTSTIKTSLALDPSANFEQLESYKSLQQWFSKLYLLHNVPFSYLIAQPKLLPQESIRFFYIDENWLNQLVYGALNIGIHSSRDVQINTMLLKSLQSTIFDKQKFTAGFLIYSKLIEHWPGLIITAHDAGGNIIPPTSSEKLNSQMQFILLPSVPDKILISEPHEQFCFGITTDASKNEVIELRQIAGDALGSPSGKNIPIIYREPAINRILKLTGPSPSLSEKINITPAELAIHLVHSPQEVILDRSKVNQSMMIKGAQINYRKLMNMQPVRQPTPHRPPLHNLRDASSSPCLLDYEIDHTTVEITQSATLIITITNKQPTDVYLQELVFSIKYNSVSDGLTDDPNSIDKQSVSVDDPPQFSISFTTDSESNLRTIMFDPKNEKDPHVTIKPGAKFNVTIKCQINGMYGTTNINVVEYIENEETPNNANLIILKSELGFCLYDFKTTDNNYFFLLGQDMGLTWKYIGEMESLSVQIANKTIKLTSDNKRACTLSTDDLPIGPNVVELIPTVRKGNESRTLSPTCLIIQMLAPKAKIDTTYFKVPEGAIAKFDITASNVEYFYLKKANITDIDNYEILPPPSAYKSTDESMRNDQDKSPYKWKPASDNSNISYNIICSDAGKYSIWMDYYFYKYDKDQQKVPGCETQSYPHNFEVASYSYQSTSDDHYDGVKTDYAMVVHPNNHRLYIMNETPNISYLSIINIEGGGFVPVKTYNDKQLRIEKGPHTLALNSKTNYLYIANGSGDNNVMDENGHYGIGTGSLSVYNIDKDQNVTHVTNMDHFIGDGSYAMVLDEDESRLYVGNNGSNTITLLRLNESNVGNWFEKLWEYKVSLQETNTFFNLRLLKTPSGVRYDDTDTLYQKFLLVNGIPNQICAVTDNRIVYSPPNGAVSATIANFNIYDFLIPQYSNGSLWSPMSNNYYCIMMQSNELVAGALCSLNGQFNRWLGSTIHTYPSQIGPHRCVINSNGDDQLKIYVISNGDNSLSLFEITYKEEFSFAINSKTDSWPVGHGPCCIVISPDNQTLYVANNISNSISVIPADNTRWREAKSYISTLRPFWQQQTSLKTNNRSQPQQVSHHPNTHTDEIDEKIGDDTKRRLRSSNPNSRVNSAPAHVLHGLFQKPTGSPSSLQQAASTSQVESKTYSPRVSS